MDGDRASGGRPLLRWEGLSDAAARYVSAMEEQRSAENTRTAYAADWRHFERWCIEVGAPPLVSPESIIAVVGTYLEWHASLLAVATLRRRVAGIRSEALRRGLPWPGDSRSPFRDHLAVIGRRQARGSGASPAISERLVRQMIACVDIDSPKGSRDAAVLLVGYLGAMRRSEIAGLDLRDASFEGDGVVLHLRKSKTDQQAHGRKVYIPLTRHPQTCAVRALQAWIAQRGNEDGPLFVSMNRAGSKPVSEASLMEPRVVDDLVKLYAAATGEVRRYTAHSLRSGLATAAAKRGASARMIMKQTGHRSLDSVEHYVQDGSGFTENVVNVLFDL